MANNLFIYGAGDFAEIANDAFSNDTSYKVKAFIVSRDIFKIKYAANPFYCDLDVMCEDEFLKNGTCSDSHFFIGIGYSGLNEYRQKKFNEFLKLGLQPATYISSHSLIGSNVEVGAGSFVLEKNNLQYKSRIGQGVVMWSSNHLGHHSEIGDFSFVASHVVISGHVRIGARCFMGVNSLIGDSLRIGDACIIGAGARILSDVADSSVVAEKGTAASKVPSYRVKI